MNKFITVIMYVVWILAILFILAATLTGFQYFDLNILAIVLFSIALLNAAFYVASRRKPQT